MKILLVSTYDTGGAATATIRLHQGLLKLGIESNLLFLFRTNNKIESSYQFPKHSILKRILWKTKIFLAKRVKNYNKINHLKKTNIEIFTFASSDYDITEHRLAREADIIHLHWVADFLDWKTFFKKNKKPLVWTLHDMNPFLGGFHYMNDKITNSKYFGSIEQEQEEIKLNAIKNISRLIISTPSKWLLKLSQNSRILGAFPHQYIPYGLDFKKFQLHDKEKCRDYFDIPRGLKVLGFISQDVTNPRKGFNLLLDIVKDPILNDVILLAIGNSSGLGPNENVRYIGRVDDEEKLSMLISCCDGFVLPSKEDNLPNVMLEALACGTPVIAFPVGGIIDAIQNDMNGVLAKDISSDSLKVAVEYFLQNLHKFDRKTIRTLAEENFDLHLQAARYLDLYSTLLI